MAITVTALSTTPVKGTRIHTVDAVTLDEQGARGDRAFYIVDEAGALVNGKRFGWLHQVVADYDGARDVLALTLPDEVRAAAPVRLGPQVTTSFFGTPRPARVLDGPWSDALSHVAGQSLRVVRGGRAVDRGLEGATTLISRGSLQRLATADTPSGARGGGSAIDARRFRMLIEIDGVEAHEEDAWIGRELVVGQARLRMRGHVGRCVTTTRGPESGEVDLATLKLLATYRLDEETTEPLAFGVHGEVLEGGVVRVGDAVTVEARVPA